MTADRPGLLLLNLGTPASPATADVRDYLREFLSDPRVIDIPGWLRWLFLRLVILPFRPRRSAEAYRKVWLAEGSPLLVHGRNLRARIQERLGRRAVVVLAMRYGEPSIAAAFRHFEHHGVRRIVVFPLYPQYSSSATGSSLERVFEVASAGANVPSLHVVPAFYDHPAFIEARAALARPVLESFRPEHVFLSFHGLPERQIRKSDRSGHHCLTRPDCCDRPVPDNAMCYRAHCFETSRRLAAALGLPADRWTVSFQSRLGRTPWIRPFTDEVLDEAVRSGVRRAAILSPAFVADCLETLEELGIRARERWKELGGEELELVPSLNDEDPWVDAVIQIAADASPWIRP